MGAAEEGLHHESNLLQHLALGMVYDRFGNRLTQTLTGGTASVYQPQLAVSETTNCITTGGFTCDASGNLTADGLHTYTYDAENRMVKLDGTNTSYAYDGAGLRVTRTQGSTKTTYIYSGSKVIEEFTGTTTKTLSAEYIYAGGQLITTITAGTTTYRHNDHLSVRVETNSSGAVTRSYGHLPFGETWYETGTASKWKFTTYAREDETRPDYAVFRSYHPRWGRFMQADPIAGDVGIPQSANRYAYVTNDPVNLTDPLGLFMWGGKIQCPDGSMHYYCPPGDSPYGQGGAGSGTPGLGGAPVPAIDSADGAHPLRPGVAGEDLPPRLRRSSSKRWVTAYLIFLESS